MIPEDRHLLRRMLLVVDDQEINRNLLGEILGSEFDLIYACNGKQAIEQVMRHRDMLSAVLLDLLMPEMDGYGVMEAMKSDEELSMIPILVLTADVTAELKSLACGATSFIPKPFESNEIVLARVRSFVELAESRRVIQAAERDPLTGLYTKQFFFTYAEQIERFHPEWEMDELAIRIERYQLLGELHGQEFLDQVSIKLGTCLQDIARHGDGICARAAHDTCYLFVRRSHFAQPQVDQIRKKLNALREHLDIRLSAGLCDIDKRKMDIRRRFDCADAACRMQEKSHPGILVIYDSSMHERELYRQKLIEDLPRALAEHELKVFFQPKYDVTKDQPRLSAAEALVRWQHPELGMVPPGEFIPLFETTGLVRRVDLYVWEETARRMQEWKERLGKELTVSVNVSSMDIHMPGLVEMLVELTRRYGIDPAAFHLEMTESAYMANTQLMIDVTKALRRNRFRIEMDDFGSGYSSLNMLSRLPVDVLKMDMLFVRSLTREDSREYQFIEIVHDIAKTLNVPMIAEGVETKEQLSMLKKIGCEYIQGYYFSPPVSAQEFEELLRQA